MFFLLLQTVHKKARILCFVVSPKCPAALHQVYDNSDGGIFRVDDVFVTGMLAEKANVSHRDISDLITFYEDWDEEVLLTGNVWWVYSIVTQPASWLVESISRNVRVFVHSNSKIKLQVTHFKTTQNNVLNFTLNFIFSRLASLCILPPIQKDIK